MLWCFNFIKVKGAMEFNSLDHINRRVHVFGFTSLQWVGLLGGTVLMVFFAPVILGVIIVPVYFLLKKVYYHNSKGDPDFLGSFYPRAMIKKYYNDKNDILGKI